MVVLGVHYYRHHLSQAPPAEHRREHRREQARARMLHTLARSVLYTPHSCAVRPLRQRLGRRPAARLRLR
jgi:hypothetical protein